MPLTPEQNERLIELRAKEAELKLGGSPELKDVLAQINELNQDIESFEEEIEEEQGSISYYEDEIKGYKASIDSSNDAIRDIERDKQAAQKDLVTLRAKEAELRMTPAKLSPQEQFEKDVLIALQSR